MLSTRPDLVGVRLAEELQQLQENVPADPPQVVRKLIEQELGQPIDELFDEFERRRHCLGLDRPGPSWRGCNSGEPVVVKVRHADIEKKVAVDMDILAGLAQLAERFPEFQNYRPRAIAEEFQRTIRRELDFRREQRNMQQFARRFPRRPDGPYPLALPGAQHGRVLDMERVEGTKLSDTAGLTGGGHRPGRGRPAGRGISI